MQCSQMRFCRNDTAQALVRLMEKRISNLILCLLCSNKVSLPKVELLKTKLKGFSFAMND